MLPVLGTGLPEMPENRTTMPQHGDREQMGVEHSLADRWTRVKGNGEHGRDLFRTVRPASK